MTYRYVCTNCRYVGGTPTCPCDRDDLIVVGLRWRAPKKRHDRAWKRIERGEILWDRAAVDRKGARKKLAAVHRRDTLAPNALRSLAATLRASGSRLRLSPKRHGALEITVTPGLSAEMIAHVDREVARLSTGRRLLVYLRGDQRAVARFVSVLRGVHAATSSVAIHAPRVVYVSLDNSGVAFSAPAL